MSALTALDLDRIDALLAQASPGEWHAGHLCDDEHSCDCAHIFDENNMGGIGSVYVNNGLLVSEGGNDAPPLTEAKANLALIVELRNAGKELVAAARAKAEYERVLRNVIDQGYQAPENEGWRLDEIMDQARAVLAGEDWVSLEKTPEQIAEYKRKWS